MSPEHSTASPMIQNDSFHEDASEFGDEDHSPFGDNGDSMDSDPNSPHAKVGFVTSIISNIEISARI